MSERLEKNKDLEDYQKRDTLMEQLSERVKGLEKDLIDRDAKIGIYLMDISKEQNLTEEWHQIAKKNEAKMKELEKELNREIIYRDTFEQAEARIRELREGIKGILNQKDLISFAIQKQLEGLIDK